MRLSEVDAFAVPREIVKATEKSLRRAGRDGFELFVLWSGRIEGDRFQVRTAHVPRQRSFKLDTGLVVRVEGEELHRLNLWLAEHQQVLAVQVHAHPTDAFHSDTDDAFPIVTTRGGLSIVAADFCADGLCTPETAVFRLGAEGWSKVENPEHLVHLG